MISPDLVWGIKSALGVCDTVLCRVLGISQETLDAWILARAPFDPTPANSRMIRLAAASVAACTDTARLGRAITEAVMREGADSGLYLLLHAKYWRLAPKQREATPTTKGRA